MAKKSKSKMGLILSIVIIVLSALTLCTLFMPMLSKSVLAVGETVGDGVKATGADLVKIAMTGELKLLEIAELTSGAQMLYGLKMAEETAFITTIFAWGYLVTLVASAVALILALLSIFGLRLKLLNTIVGIALVVLAIATFVFGLIVASKNTALTEGVLSGKETGTLTVIALGVYALIGTLVAGCVELIKARKK